MFAKKLLHAHYGDLKIDKILTKCFADESVRVITIPDTVEFVMIDAFDGYEDLKIKDEKKLALQLSSKIELIFKMGLNGHWYGTESIKEYGPLLPVLNVEASIILKSINEAIKGIKANHGKELQFVEIDADEIPRICIQMKEYPEEIIKDKGETIKTLENIPFISSYDHIEREGYGIFFIRNLNRDNYKSFTHNFIYSLIKHHSFNHYKLNPHWIVVMEVGEGVILDAPGGCRFIFDGNHHLFKSPEKYIEYMNEKGKVLGNIKEKSEPDPISKENEKVNQEKESGDLFEDLLELYNEEEDKESNIKEKIDWEERHFQICLALMNGKNLIQDIPKTIIRQADSMVETLKKHYQENKQG